jgi:endonuclease-3
MSAAPAKQPFDIDLVMPRIREAVRPLPKAAMFQLADEGFSGLFQQLVACVISIRTRDEAMLVMARQLFARAPTPADVARLSPDELDALIGQSSFHEAKVRQIQAIARAAAKQYDGELPCDFAVLTSFAGVGPKCANLALSLACGQTRIGVDVHVHRVTNRWGYVQTRTPEDTMAALESKLPTGSRSTPCWCPSASISAPASTPTAPPAPCSICASNAASWSRVEGISARA